MNNTTNNTKTQKKSKGRIDVSGLILGVLLTTVAVAALWIAFGAPIDTYWLKIAAPLYLVVIGAVGLALSHGSHQQ